MASRSHWCKLPREISKYGPGAFVVVTLNSWQFTATVARIGALRKVLPQKPIQFFIRAALPRAARVADVHLTAGGSRDFQVAGAISLLIPGDRLQQHSSQPGQHTLLLAALWNCHEFSADWFGPYASRCCSQAVAVFLDVALALQGSSPAATAGAAGPAFATGCA